MSIQAELRFVTLSLLPYSLASNASRHSVHWLLMELQVILCNDCEKKGTAPFHWLYHKCSSCGSYNTRLL